MDDTLSERADRRATLDEAETAWQRFQAAFAGLTEDDFERPGAEGIWSLKDTLAHINGWFVEANRWLDEGLTDQPFPANFDFDGYNARSVELRSAADPVAVIDELRELFAAWKGLVARIPAERFTIRLTRHWTIRAMIHHFAEHAPAIDAARRLSESAG